MSTRPIWPPAADALAAKHRVAPPTDNRAAHNTADAHEDQPLLSRFAMWPVTRPNRSALQTATGFALFVAILRFPSFINGEWGSFFAHLRAGGFVLAWMLLATLVTRTVTARQVLSTWLSGVFVAGTIVDGVGALLDDHITGDAFTAGVVPILEEVMKLAPVVFFVVINRRRGRGFAALDLAILGAASGAGFAMYEDMLWGRRFVSGVSGGWSNVVPTILQEPLFVGGHLVWTTLLALGIGVLVVHHKAAVAWIVGPALIALPLIDHAAINYRGEQYASLRSALMDGRLAVMVMLIAFAAVLVREITVTQRSNARDHLFRSRTFTELLKAPVPKPFVSRTSERQFQRTRNSIIFDEHRTGAVNTAGAAELAWIEARLVVPAATEPAVHQPATT